MFAFVAYRNRRTGETYYTRVDASSLAGVIRELQRDGFDCTGVTIH